jgi:hypothetical protein
MGWWKVQSTVFSRPACIREDWIGLKPIIRAERRRENEIRCSVLRARCRWTGSHIEREGDVVLARQLLFYQPLSTLPGEILILGDVSDMVDSSHLVIQPLSILLPSHNTVELHLYGIHLLQHNGRSRLCPPQLYMTLTLL